MFVTRLTRGAWLLPLCLGVALACGEDEPFEALAGGGGTVAVDAAAGKDAAVDATSKDAGKDAASDALADVGSDATADAKPSVDAASDADATVAIVPDFALVDENAASTTYQTSVSPRDYLGQVSAWYFGHAT
ncbi:MAG TPA: hypothetical protein PKD61_31945 [Polyangiaceae bacterium]|nr:hypothetical protein [Polyangiaceae bacterium]